MIKTLLLSLFLLSTIVSFTQTYDTISIYFALDSDRPIVNRTTEYANYEQPTPGMLSVIRLEAHCDTTGSMEYNDDLAQRRMDAVIQMMAKHRWLVSNAKRKIYSERKAGEDENYTHDIYRRVDVIIKIQPPTNAQLLTMKLNSFANDTSQFTQIDLTILFHGGTTTMMSESVSEAKALRDFMLAHPEINADIHGHVCCGDNYPLSLGRAKLITEFLMKQGVAASRLTYQGHSNSQPKVWPETTDEERKQNRRVTVDFKKVKQNKDGKTTEKRRLRF
ncbi:MAG: OmpA family protein [bacterium]|nr:OmpA family protein [bacterium]